MFTQEDKIQLQEKGITLEQAQGQLQNFQQGFPYLRLQSAAAIGRGIIRPTSEEANDYISQWSQYKGEGHRITKFVPASGAASRMFKNLFEFLDAGYDVPTTDFEKHFFQRIRAFAFYPDLNESCLRNEGSEIDSLLANGCYKAVVSNLLLPKGLNYGQLPKGLLKFHTYPEGARTPVEEHLVEAALYASSDGKADVHFTVSAEHQALFEQLIREKVPQYEAQFGVCYNVTFSVQ